MPVTTYKPMLLYALALVVLGIAASAFESRALTYVAIAGYLVGWLVFLWNVTTSRGRS
jgi:hypothetical protein